ncbi:MAG: phage holin family protein [Arachnia sp.]
MRLLLRLLLSAGATALAVWLVPGISLSAVDRQEQVLTLLGVAVIFALVNAVIKPIATFASFCLIVLTLGLFAIVINAGMLQLTSWLSEQFGLGFHVEGFWAAVYGAIVISIATAVGNSILLRDDRRSRDN